MTVLFKNQLFGDNNAEGWQYSIMPTASGSFENKIIQYVGTTNSTYTNGYTYKCIGTHTAAVSESVTVNQTAGFDMGDFTVDINKYKEQTNSNTSTLSFSFIGNPTKVVAWNMNTLAQQTFDRETAMDTRYSYGWIDGTNNYYWTSTLTPDMNTEFYSDSNLSTGSGYTYLSTTTRATSGFSGYWAYTGEEGMLDLLNDFGIGNDVAPMVGVTIQVTYSAGTPANDTYEWQRWDVQPVLDLTTITGYDADTTQTLQHDMNGNIKWV